MSDFTYDNEDFTAVRVATTDLNRIQSQATKAVTLSSAAYISWQYFTRKAGSLWTKSPALVFGSAILSSCIVQLIPYCRYTTATWLSRSRLDDAAAHINTKYSSIIARTLNYEGSIQ